MNTDQFLLEMHARADERTLLGALWRKPGDLAARNAYVDYLIQEGRNASAEAVRRGWVPGFGNAHTWYTQDAVAIGDQALTTCTHCGIVRNEYNGSSACVGATAAVLSDSVGMGRVGMGRLYHNPLINMSSGIDRPFPHWISSGAVVTMPVIRISDNTLG